MYKSDSVPEINYDVLFKEGENIRVSYSLNQVMVISRQFIHVK